MRRKEDYFVRLMFSEESRNGGAATKAFIQG